MAAPTKMEFAVNMTCEGCAKRIKDKLHSETGVLSVVTDVPNKLVLVEASLPSSKVEKLIKETGKDVVPRGFGSTSADGAHHGAAVAEVFSAAVRGVVRMTQADAARCVVDGTLDGLEPQRPLRLRIHQLGDLSRGCDSCGDMLTSDAGENIGDLCDVTAEANGRASFRVVSEKIHVSDMIGRSVVLHDTLSTNRLACGIIGRSAGVLQNRKRICACDGLTLWDEQHVPAVGPARAEYARTKARDLLADNPVRLPIMELMLKHQE